MNLFNEIIELPSGVKVVYSKWDALLHGKPQIEPKNENIFYDTIRGNHLTIIGTDNPDDKVKISGNDNTVKKVENLDFWGNRGEITATPNKDNYYVISSDTVINNAAKNDKIIKSKYTADERPTVLEKFIKFSWGFLGTGGGFEGNFPGGISNPANPLSPVGK